MTKTKSSLLLSAISLLLCVSMLIGTTFAWFTDSVTSSGNKIESGTLKVDLKLLEKDNTTWTSLKNVNTKLFNYDKWEPGYTEIKILRVQNEGTLALKWVAQFVSDAELSKLADVIDVYVTTAKLDAYPTNRDVVKNWTKAGTVAEFVNTIQTTTKGTLLANDNQPDGADEAYLGIALKMREEANNDYQNLDLGGEFDIRIFATQLNSEKDSIDENYDEDADYDGEISTASALAAAIAEGGSFKLLKDIELDSDSVLEIASTTTLALDLNGKSITSSNSMSTGIAIVNNGTLTISDGTIENTTENGNAVINNKGTLTLDGVTVEGAPIGATGYPEYTILNTGKLTIDEGTTIVSDRGALYLGNGSDVTINGGDISVTDTLGSRVLTAHVIYAKSGTKLTINGGNFALDYEAGANTGASVICPAGGEINIYGGNFSYAGTVGQSGIFQNYMGYGDHINVYGGTYNDTTVNGVVTQNHFPIADGCIVVDNGDGTYTVADVSDKAKVDEGLYTDADGNYYVYNAEGFKNLETVLTTNNAGRYTLGFNRTFSLEANIDATGMTWDSLWLEGGSGHENGMVFDGNGFTISNLTINGGSLFTGVACGVGGTPAVIKDVTFDNVTVNPTANGYHVGVIWGQLYGDITFENVKVLNSHVNGGCNVAGFVGATTYEGTHYPDIVFRNCSVNDTIITATGEGDPFGANAFVGRAYGSTTITFEGSNEANANTYTCNNSAITANGGIYAYGIYDTAWNVGGVVNNFTNFSGYQG